MEPVLAYQPLHAAGQVAIHDVRCRAHRSGPGAEERARRFTISLPRRGVFVRHGEGDAVTADATRVVLFWPDRPYRVSHPTGAGDDCTAIEFDDSTLRAAAAHLRLDVDAPGVGRKNTAACDRTLFRLVHRLRQGLRAGRIEPMAVDEAAFGVLAAVLEQHPARRTGRRAARTATRRAHRRLVETTREAIAAHHREPLRLSDLAAHAGVSAFHLARVFRAETGGAVHRHLNAVRLRAALDRVLAGDRDLTGVALDCGFSSHSHLSNAFRREFGVPPSRLRRPPAEAELVRLSRILQAAPRPSR